MSWEYLPENLTREKLKKFCGESPVKFAGRLEHAARYSWQLTRSYPEKREIHLRTGRRLGQFATEIREFMGRKNHD